MSFTPGSVIEFTVDCKSNYSSGMKWGEMMEQVFLPAFTNNLSANCRYTTTTTGSYPAIVIPWIDDQPTTDSSTALCFTCGGGAANTNMSTSNTELKFCSLGYGNGTSPLLRTNYDAKCLRNGQQYNGSRAGNWTNGVYRFKFVIQTSGDMSIGYTYYSNTTDTVDISPRFFVSKIKKKTDDSYCNCVWMSNHLNTPHSTSGTGQGVSQLYIEDNNHINGMFMFPAITAEFFGNNIGGYSRSNVGIVTAVDTGDYRHDSWYVYSMIHSSMVGEWNTNLSLITDNTYKINPWYPNAFTINNQSYDALILGNEYQTSYTNFFDCNLCRKHIETPQEGGE